MGSVNIAAFERTDDGDCVAVCYSVLQCVAVCCRVSMWLLLSALMMVIVLQCVAECCRVLQCVAVCQRACF